MSFLSFETKAGVKLSGEEVMSCLVKSEAMPNTVPGMMPGMPGQPHVQYAAMPSGAFGVDKLHCCGIEITFLGFAYQVDVGQGC